MSTTHAPDTILTADAGLDQVFELAQQLRVDSIRCTTQAGSGHPTSSMSAADLMAVLLARHLRYNWSDPDDPGNDHLVFSKGHASPLLYSMFKAAGVLSDIDFVEGYRKAGSRLQGHPTPVLPWVDAATGSLGQGVGIAVGIALAGRLGPPPRPRVWVLCGDSEMTEGSVWEALDAAAREGLSEMTVVVDVNRLGQRGPTELGWDLEAYARRVQSFGCLPVLVDGHDVASIDEAFTIAAGATVPAVVLARTIKGRGVADIAGLGGWHGKALPADAAELAIAELGGERSLFAEGPGPRERLSQPPETDRTFHLPTFPQSEKVATRMACGKTLAVLAARPRVVVLDAEVGNSTYTEEFAAACPERFFQCYIAEQQMIASAVGLSVCGYQPYAATFAAFLTRAYDFIRMAAVTGADLALIGTHCGVEIGEDGPSQMGLEDLAMMRAVHGSTVLYPSDATSAAHLTAAMAQTPGISYLRATRGAYPVLYPSFEYFPVGGSKTLRATEFDRVALISAGVGVHQCLAAAEQLAAEGISARVLDMYSVKPLDGTAVARAVAETEVQVVVEDHHPEGGLGEAVFGELALRGVGGRFGHLAVRIMPDSRSSAEELDAAGISAPHIVAKVRELLPG